MKNKKYISCLLIGLLSLTGCVFDSTSNSSNSSSSSNTSTASDSTNGAKKENYFSENLQHY